MPSSLPASIDVRSLNSADLLQAYRHSVLEVNWWARQLIASRQIITGGPKITDIRMKLSKWSAHSKELELEVLKRMSNA